MGMDLKMGYTPNEIALFYSRDNDQQNHWVSRDNDHSTLFSDKHKCLLWQCTVIKPEKRGAQTPWEMMTSAWHTRFIYPRYGSGCAMWYSTTSLGTMNSRQADCRSPSQRRQSFWGSKMRGMALRGRCSWCRYHVRLYVFTQEKTQRVSATISLGRSKEWSQLESRIS